MICRRGLRHDRDSARSTSRSGPLSTTTPPMLVPWPPMNFVAECTTMSAPHSIGRHRYGVANVLSIISGAPWSWATCASASMSSTLPAGLPIVSPKSSLVSSVSAPRQASSRSGSTNVSPIPQFAQQVLQLRDRAAVQRARRDDVIARFQHREQRRRLRGQAARERDPPDAAFEARDALFERGRRSDS